MKSGNQLGIYFAYINLYGAVFTQKQKMDVEIGAHLFEKDLQDIWFFATSYISRYRTGNYRKFLTEVIDEIKNFGTIELSRKRKILKSIKTTQRRMHGK